MRCRSPRGFRPLERDVAEARLPAAHLDDAHRAVRGTAAVGRTSRVEDLEGTEARMLGKVAVTEDRAVGARKPGAEPLCASRPRPGVVDDRDPRASDLNLQRRG